MPRKPVNKGGRPRKRPPLPPAEYEEPANVLERIPFLERELTRAEVVLSEMEQQGSWGAVTQQRRLVLGMHAELLELRERAASYNPLDDMSDEELLAAEIEEILQLPDHLVEPLAVAILQRMGPQWVAHHASRGHRPRVIEARDDD
jgi:hypothetical protein